MNSQEVISKAINILDSKLATEELYAIWVSLESNEFGLYNALEELQKRRLQDLKEASK